MTLNDLAKKLGVSRQALYLQINNNPRISTLQRIADALGVPVAQLFDQTQPTNADHNTITCPHCGAKLQINLSVSDKKQE
nr:MAG TPA: hypothetical protein [Caudoviricetes sp.]